MRHLGELRRRVSRPNSPSIVEHDRTRHFAEALVEQALEGLDVVAFVGGLVSREGARSAWPTPAAAPRRVPHLRPAAGSTASGYEAPPL